MDRRPLRAEFDSLKNTRKADANFVTRSEQLVSLHKDLVDGFKFLVDFLDGKTSKTEVVNQLEKYATTDDLKSVVSAVEKLDKTVAGKDIDLKPLLEALKGLQSEIATIPKELPEFEQRESVKVENLDEIKFDTSKVVEAIKALKLKVDAPIINVEKPNLKPLQDLMLDLLKSFNKVKLEVPKILKIDNLKDIPLADLSKTEKKLDESNKLLKVISEKKMGGGGGGGNGTPYLDSTGKLSNVTLKADGSIPVSVVPLDTIYNGSKTAPTVTAEAITTTQVISTVTVKALSTNTASVYIGKTGVTVSTGLELSAGESISMDISDLASVFVISGSSSQIVRWIGV